MKCTYFPTISSSWADQIKNLNRLNMAQRVIVDLPLDFTSFTGASVIVEVGSFPHESRALREVPRLGSGEQGSDGMSRLRV